MDGCVSVLREKFLLDSGELNLTNIFYSLWHMVWHSNVTLQWQLFDVW